MLDYIKFSSAPLKQGSSQERALHRVVLARKASPGNITSAEENIIRADERERAGAVARATDNIGFIPVETLVRVLRQKTREGGKGDKFSKGETSVWSRETYLVLKRSGVNSFLINVPPGEVKIWPAHSLRAAAPPEEIKARPPTPSPSELSPPPSSKLDIKVVRAKRLESRNISEEEQAEALAAPARAKRAIKMPSKFLD